MRQLLRAHEYWRMKQLAVDLVILNERAPSYVQDLQALLETLVRTSQSAGPHEGAGAARHVYIVRADRVTSPQRDVLQSVARVVLSSRRGTLAEQLARAQRPDAAVGPPRRSPPAKVTAEGTRPALELELFNGLGGFARGWTRVRDRAAPGAVDAGAVDQRDRESGLRLPGLRVRVPGTRGRSTAARTSSRPGPTMRSAIRRGRSIYVRDEETGELWGPTALPVREETTPYVIRHGQGYTRFEHVSHGIALELLQLVPLDDPIKISRLTLTNASGRPRRLSVTAYVEWVLGVSRGAAAPFTVTEIDRQDRRDVRAQRVATRVRRARRLRRPRRPQTAWTADRTEFLGRNGAPDRPAALAPRQRLSGRVGAGLDPCGALQTTVELPAGRPRGGRVLPRRGGERGAGPGADRSLSRAGTWTAILELVGEHWDQMLGTVQVRTPDRAMDILLNRWLLYQTLACRVWARSAFYQAGGAYGFRDQLQDVMALMVAAPGLAREHLLRAAARQFVEGDVQHWWHPPSGRGVRTRISDDRLWLPYVVARYLDVSGDGAVLDEVVPFLDGARPRRRAARVVLRASRLRGAGHALRALRARARPQPDRRRPRPAADGHRRLERRDERGGRPGQGRERLARVVPARGAVRMGAAGRRARARASGPSGGVSTSRALKASLEREAWDGDWYRRAYFDDGTPLGSAGNDACRIDSIAQSWSVISAAGDPARQARAMAAVDEHLVRRADGARAAAHAAVRRARRWSPATSRAMSRASARTADSTRTPRSGRRSPSRCSATETGPASCSRC